MIGFHASHEQLGPDVLLQCVRDAEQAGFDAAMCSDHFYPWSDEQGESGFAWSWLGAAMQATNLPFGVVCAPGQRYHPAIIAQAAATLEVMFPNRFWLAIGSGQFLNEHITGDGWPQKSERNQRLRECAGIIKALWAGETVTHRGLVTVEDAMLYTRPIQPARPPLLVGAAVTPDTARFVADWADALITVWQPGETLARIIDAFRSAGGAGKPVFLQMHVAHAASDDEARAQAHRQWRQNVHPSSVLTDVRTVAQMQALGQNVRPEDMDAAVRISASPQQHLEWLATELERFDSVFVHGVGDEQRAFIEMYGSKVIPAIGSR